MKEKVVAEITRIGDDYNVRVLYGDDDSRKPIRFVKDEAVKSFACYMYRKSYGEKAENGIHLFDVKRRVNVTRSNITRDFYVAFEGGEAMTMLNARLFLYTLGMALGNLDIRGTLEVSAPDVGVTVQFDEDGYWETQLNDLFN